MVRSDSGPWGWGNLAAPRSFPIRAVRRGTARPGVRHAATLARRRPRLVHNTAQGGAVSDRGECAMGTSSATTRVKDVLTTGKVAKICNVAPRTVSKWFDVGVLDGYRIPGSKDRR